MIAPSETEGAYIAAANNPRVLFISKISPKLQSTRARPRAFLSFDGQRREKNWPDKRHDGMEERKKRDRHLLRWSNQKLVSLSKLVSRAMS